MEHMEREWTQDKTQQYLASYARALTYEDLPPEVVHAAKVRVVDTLGCVIGGFFGAPCRIARSIALRHSGTELATVIGTSTKSSVEMAAFANAATARYLDYNDVGLCHPSDMLTPVLAVAESAHASGQDLIVAIVLAYEVFMSVTTAIDQPPPGDKGWDYLTWEPLGVGLGAGKIWGLSEEQMKHCISLAIVPNNALGQNRQRELSMWKGAGAGQAGKAGVFAAMLAREGMEGPYLPFEGDSGFFKAMGGGDLISRGPMGGKDIPFKLLSSTSIKRYPCRGGNLSSIAAALKVHPSLKNMEDIEQVTVYMRDPEPHNTDPEHRPEIWHPKTRETADHSVPYTTTVALMDGTIGAASYVEGRWHDPELLALVQKVRFATEPSFTQRYQCRVEVITKDGKRHVGEAKSLEDCYLATDEEIEEKFVGQTQEVLGKKRAEDILATLWRLEEMPDVAPVPTAFTA
ncbi:MmgE/PrpD family protein [Chloroflexota bacterium]